MLQKIKDFFNNSKKWIVLAIIGILGLIGLWVQKVREQSVPEEKRLKDLKEKEELLEQTRKAREDAILAEKRASDAKAHAEALKEKIHLAKLARENEPAFKKELETQLGLKEKKKKGRPKK